jgi:hypothetical protein
LSAFGYFPPRLSLLKVLQCLISLNTSTCRIHDLRAACRRAWLEHIKIQTHGLECWLEVQLQVYWGILHCFLKVPDWRSFVRDATSAGLYWQNSIEIFGLDKRQKLELVGPGGHLVEVVAWAENDVLDSGVSHDLSIDVNVLDHVTNSQCHDRCVWNVDGAMHVRAIREGCKRQVDVGDAYSLEAVQSLKTVTSSSSQKCLESTYPWFQWLC